MGALAKLADNVYMHADQGIINYLGVLPGIIAVYGACGQQFFSYEEGGIKGLKMFLETPSLVMERAQFHKNGTVNKQRFFRNLDKLVVDGAFSVTTAATLRAMAEKCDCPAYTFAGKLLKAKLGITEELVKTLDFYDPEQPLLDTCATFEAILQELNVEGEI